MKLIALIILGFLACATVLHADQTNVPAELSLRDAQLMALRNHPQIVAADYRALAAEEAFKAARAGYFPDANLLVDAVGANDEGTRILAGGLNNPSVYDRAAGGVAVSQLITDFGHTANLVNGSKYQAGAERQNANATREQVLLGVNIGYFSALHAQAVLRVARQTLDTRQLLLDQVTLLASNQLKSALDVSFARVAVQEARLLFERAQNDADAAFAALASDLGERQPKPYILQEPASMPGPITNDVSDFVQTALARRPELQSLRDSGQAAASFARSQRDARLPTIDALGVAGISPIHDSVLPHDYSAAGVQLSLPLFAGGSYVARQHEAELKSQADMELLRSAEDDIVRDVHVAYLNLMNARQEIQTTAELVTNAAEAYDLAAARYKIGSSSIVELSQAQLGLTSAQITDTNARYELLIRESNLEYEIGELEGPVKP